VVPETEISPPDLNRPLIFPTDMPREKQEEMRLKLNMIAAALKADQNLFSQWIELGLYRKAIGDYEGAREAWEYASAIRPKNSLSFGNLGYLYGYYLNDPVKAERNFLTALDNDHTLLYLYAQTAEFYRYVLKDEEKAQEILRRGVAMNPDNQDFKILLKEF
jgi:tetratricopeptide (TPR) repeat protein